MKSEQWKTYRTRFLVKAKQLSSSLSFVDHLGRQHCGRKGDYLVESSDGVISIARRQIFEDIYVPMFLQDQPACGETVVGEPKLDRLRFEPLEIEEVKLAKSPIGREPLDQSRMMPHGMVRSDLVRADRAGSGRRKLPQPCRDRRASAPSLRLM